jgi:hypothetical protein
MEFSSNITDTGEGEPSRYSFPPLPELGQEDKFYGKLAHRAEKDGDIYGVSANKVAQYITLGRDAEAWPEKLRYFRHALEKHAQPKPPINDEVWAFYQQLQDWVRRETGKQALRLVEREDEFYMERIAQHELKFRITSDAAQFFRQFHLDEQPDWFNAEDLRKMQLIRSKWA